METSSRALAEEKIPRLLFRFALPCILSLWITTSYNVVDQIFIGNSSLGYLGNAATGVVFPLFIVCQAFAWWLGDGCAAHLALCQGKKDTHDVHRNIGVSILFVALSSVILLLLALTLKEPLLRLFGATDQSLGMASDYLTVVAGFFPLFMFFSFLSPLIRADGSPVYALICLAVGAVANLALDPLFIHVFHWGVAGAAWATVIGQSLSFVFSLVYLFRSKTFRLSAKSFIPSIKAFHVPASLGISSFVTQFAIVVITVVSNSVLVRYGGLSVYGSNIPVSAMSVETKVFTLLINVVMGVALGGVPILSYNVGAENPKRVKETYRLILFSTLALLTLFTLVNEIYPDLFIAIFGSADDALYMEYARYVFRIFLSTMALTAFIKVTAVFFQASGKPIQSLLCSLARDVLVFVPGLVLIPLFYETGHPGKGIIALLFAAPLADLLCLFLAGGLLFPHLKSLSPATPKAPKKRDVDLSRPFTPGLIVCVSREHGTMGKGIAKALAKRMGVPCYDKEAIAIAAKEMGLFLSDVDVSHLLLSKDVFAQTYDTQSQVIRKIASRGSCVFVGRAAAHFLQDHQNVLRIFIYADQDTRIHNLGVMYGDDPDTARKNIHKSDQSRAKYYRAITGEEWGNMEDYDLCIDASHGFDATLEVLYGYVMREGIRPVDAPSDNPIR